MQFHPTLYDIVSVGLKADILLKLQLFTKANVKFNSMDKSSNWAADVETKPEKYGKHQQEPQGESSRPGGRTRNIWSSISEGKDVT